MTNASPMVLVAFWGRPRSQRKTLARVATGSGLQTNAYIGQVSIAGCVDLTATRQVSYLGCYCVA